MNPTIRIFHFLIAAVSVCLWLSEPPSAQCFYNPSTGRWLNRDPAPEAGFRLMAARSAGNAANQPPLHSTRSRADSSRMIHGIDTHPYTFVYNGPVWAIDPRGLDPTFISCTEDQKGKIMNAIENACKEIQNPALSCCAGVNYRFYSGLWGVCLRKNDLIITCPPSTEEHCKDGDCARAMQPGDHMWICPPAFESPGCGSLTCTMLHELVHLAGGDQATAFRYENCSRQYGNCITPGH